MYQAKNYRGIHITCNISKIAEKVIGNPLIAHLQQFGFGDSQWAFRPNSSSRDLLTILTSNWILAIRTGNKIGAYFSDIAGAFDKVDKEYMLIKLANVGVSDLFLDFLNSCMGRAAIEGIYPESSNSVS